MLAVLLAGVALYGIVVLLAWLAQDRLLYFPQRLPRAALEREALRRDLQLWPPNAENYLALSAAASTPDPRLTIIVFHGNAGSAIDRSFYATALEPRRARVLLAEYPGYGAREGRPREESLVASGVQLVETARAQFEGPLLLWGESMGAAVAAGVAARLRDDSSAARLCGLVLLTPWRSLPELAQALYPWLPARWLTRDRYDIAAWSRSVPLPKAVLMSERDEVIPASQTRRLYDGLPEPKRLWIFDAAGHNTWPAAPHFGWWDEVLDFVLGPAFDATDSSGS